MTPHHDNRLRILKQNECNTKLVLYSTIYGNRI